MKLGLIDYGRGNLRSVEKALGKSGACVQRVAKAAEFEDMDGLVLPGVGAFGDAMKNLRQQELAEPILNWVKADRPFLGICLGYQLLFENSVESPGVEGIGFLKGPVIRFPATVGKVPHMGWNEVEIAKRDDSLLTGLSKHPYFYHVHSYYPGGVPEDWLACSTEYGGITFPSGVGKGNVHAFQFHPEKSQADGLKLLAAFVERVKAVEPV